MSQCVLEPVFDIARGRLLVYELARLQVAQHMVKPLVRPLDNLADQ
jgi:hypothetical protein